MRFLKRRVSMQTVLNEPRSNRLVLIRWLYFSGLVVLALWLGNMLFGDRLYLSSEGLVLGEPAVVAAEFPVTVRDILVREGESVQAGQVVAIVSSQAVAETIASLSASVAGHMTRESELRIRSDVVEAMIPFAEKRQEIASGARKELESLLERRYLALNQHTTAIENEYRGVQDLQVLKSEKRSIESEVKTLGAALAEEKAAVTDLRGIYDKGRLKSPIDGVVTRLIAYKGAVVRAGEPLMELSSSHKYVLAYLPTGALFNVKVGDEVAIKTGLQSKRGVITRVEPFAAALPREFQRAFVPVERQQVLRIEFLADESPPPLFSKVQVTSGALLPRELSAVADKWLSKGKRLFQRWTTLARSGGDP
jgi:multidrug resistance efflux pump